jgi:hypothetical protein
MLIWSKPSHSASCHPLPAPIMVKGSSEASFEIARQHLLLPTISWSTIALISRIGLVDFTDLELRWNGPVLAGAVNSGRPMPARSSLNGMASRTGSAFIAMRPIATVNDAVQRSAGRFRKTKLCPSSIRASLWAGAQFDRVLFLCETQNVPPSV